jgi:hypothetical protein
MKKEKSQTIILNKRTPYQAKNEKTKRNEHKSEHSKEENDNTQISKHRWQNRSWNKILEIKQARNDLLEYQWGSE